MVFWTIQSKEVLQIAKENGVYYPDFKLSPQKHKKAYQGILDSFNQNNKTAYNGLVFCIAPEYDTLVVREFCDVSDVQCFFGDNSIRDTLSEEPYYLFNTDHILLKIVEPDFDGTNTIPIDFWNLLFIIDYPSIDDFEFCKNNSPYRDYEYAEFEERVIEAIENGDYLPSIMTASNSCMTEIYIPYIRYTSIKEIHEISELQ